MVYRPDPATLAKKLDKVFCKKVKKNEIGNAAVSVFQDGQLLCRRFYGTTTLDGSEQPDENSVFRLASMSKPITAVAVLMQCQKGLLELDAPLHQYIPAFREMHIAKAENGQVVTVQKAQTAITVRHLLTHTSGIGSGEVGMLQLNLMKREQGENLEQAVQFYASQPLAFEPGTKTDYSPLFAFDVLAYLVQLTAGKSYNEFLQTELFAPLGMTDTFFEPLGMQNEKIVYLHEQKDGKNADATPADGAMFPGVPNSRCCGGAGLAGTLCDYEKFAQMLLNGKTADGKTILTPESLAQMASAQVSEEIMPGAQKWGLGVRVITGKGTYLPIGTFGWSGAYGTHYWTDPANGIAAVMMRNSTVDGGAGSRLGTKFEKIVYTSK